MRDRPLVLLVGSETALDPTLKRCGFRVIGVLTPEEALFELGQHVVDAVVAVLPLPGMGLVGLCRSLRLRCRTPVLAVSADDGRWRDALEVGADDHVTLPCDERELRARLHALVRRTRGSLLPRTEVRVGELAIELNGGRVTVDPAIPFTAMQETLLSEFAAHPGVMLSDAALGHQVRAVHGETSAVQLDAELRGLQAAVAVASGVDDALEHLGGVGWRLTARVE